MEDVKIKIRNKRYEDMLFDYKTVPLTDYRAGKFTEPYVVTKYKEKVRPSTPPKYTVKNTHTMSDWSGDKVRFDLFLRPKEIIQTDPRKTQSYGEAPKDTEREEAQRTRPRLVMTPAVSMDDIEDPTTRALLIDDMYTSATAAGLQEAVKPYYRVAAPLTGHNAKANEVSPPKYGPPVVPDEWRIDSVMWDNRQLRCYCDATKEFWLDKPLSKCVACDASAIMQKHREAQKLAKLQQLK